jgi:hypothetical protein
MGFVIVVENEDGERLTAVEDPVNLLGRLIPANSKRFPLIGFIDPYGDTVFNRLQTMRFLEEWQYVVEAAQTEEEKDIVTRVMSLAARVRDEPHLYLKFHGD